MSKKSRYLLILLGVVVFLILAPLAVIYVRGFTYDFKNNTFVATGILATNVQPSYADIYLDGSLKRNSSGDIKFVLPKEYEVTIKSPGYNDWSKRLGVNPNEVTWSNPAGSKVYLLLKNPLAKTLVSNVLDFYNKGNSLVYLTADSITVGSLSEPSGTKYTLPAQTLAAQPVNKIMATNDAGTNFILTNNSPATSTKPIILLFNATSGKITDLSNLFQTQPQLKFNGSGLFGLTNQTLYKVDVLNKTKLPIFGGVMAFYFQDQGLYFIQKKDGVLSLQFSQAPFVNTQTLLNNLPALNNPEIFVTFEKQIFILSNGSLYLANSQMETLAQNVNSWQTGPQTTQLAVESSGELDYYDPLAKNLNFVTRSSQALGGFAIKNNIGYAFFSLGGELSAIELDDRDHQNQYVIYSGQNIQKFVGDYAAENILILDSGELKTIKIR
ncbi:MAG TPA: PEGA domain-containing protein [Candidatus Limnocylindria bacterium]|nr:PEGA domain-containing protein [Candidatus Limnocylindria bacterium]